MTGGWPGRCRLRSLTALEGARASRPPIPEHSCPMGDSVFKRIEVIGATAFSWQRSSEPEDAVRGSRKPAAAITPRRADPAPGRCRAGEELACSKDLTGRRCLPVAPEWAEGRQGALHLFSNCDTSQILISPWPRYPPAEARRLPSGLKATSSTAAVCPLRGRIIWPVAASHTVTV